MKPLHKLGLVLAMAMLAIGLLAGCGGNDSSETNNGAANGQPAAADGDTAGATNGAEASSSDDSDDAAPDGEADAEETEGATRTVTTAGRTTDIPAQPERIVLTYDDDVDHFMALGLKPVAVPEYQRTDNIDGYLPYLAEELQGVQTFPLSTDFEPILSAEPDLIVAGYHHREVLEELEKIAPTVYFEWKVDWRDTHLEMGRALGLEAQAQANVDAFNAETETTRAHLAEIIGDEPVAFIRVRQNQLELYGAPDISAAASASFILYNLLGLTPVQDATTETWGEVYSLEAFTASEAEHLFLFVQENEDDQALVEELLSSNLYQNVPAIQKGQVYMVSSYPWERGGPIAFTAGMAEIREMVKP
ncbi:ABC transporter substrate-binding protein [Paenibacillus sp. IB182496]|uniref:ABC transporter substrate-binding protein n=1 Tax=Paenibacillus sabuli TaxID=2772509 RepID=A0A927GRM9_9BACL|nr:ABC transporter substrate-binding protein [Paenibacillus sabuli]MBD2844847.1 ABC transporter substrate-binding protein [Paenibacillus sabuli]